MKVLAAMSIANISDSRRMAATGNFMTTLTALFATSEGDFVMAVKTCAWLLRGLFNNADNPFMAV